MTDSYWDDVLENKRTRYHRKPIPAEKRVGTFGRRKILEQMGFASYAAYLRSPLWQDIRKRVFAMRGNKCYLCGKKATSIHHQSYSIHTLTGKKLHSLYPICNGCHHAIEIKPNGKKRRFRDVKREFKKRTG